MTLTYSTKNTASFGNDHNKHTFQRTKQFVPALLKLHLDKINRYGFTVLHKILEMFKLQKQ